jgi:ATP-binding cassette subfamily C (CFTR/MRP) protein 1
MASKQSIQERYSFNNQIIILILIRTLGYRCDLRFEDLPLIDQSLTSSVSQARLEHGWTTSKQKSSRSSIYRELLGVLWIDILRPIVPKFLHLGTTLAQPFLITAAVRFISDKDGGENPTIGYILVLAFFFNYFGMAIMNTWYNQSLARCSTKIRGILIPFIYNRAIVHFCREEDAGASVSVLMTVDVQKVALSVMVLHEIWAVFLGFIVASYMLYTQLGLAFIPPICVSILAILVCSFVAMPLKTRQLAMSNATEKRVHEISSVSASMKNIRMLSLPGAVFESLTMLRREEITKQT